jgi:hypothetical protein
VSKTTTYSLIADFVLVIHFGIVAFVVLGLVAIWIGYALRWDWVRNFYFRAAHLAIMAVVASQALCDIACPLTIWERELRVLAGDGQHYEESFLQHWIHKVLFLSFSSNTFTIAYVVFFITLVLSLVVVRPRRRHT